MTGSIKVDQIPQTRISTDSKPLLSSTCIIKLRDPLTQAVLREIALDDVYTLNPDELATYDIKIWRGIDTLAINCGTAATLELSGSLALRNLIICSAGNVKLNSGINAASAMHIKAAAVEFSDKVATKDLVLDCDKIVANIIDVPKDGCAQIVNAKDCTFRTLSTQGKVDLKASFVTCDSIFLPAAGEVNVDQCILSVNKSINGPGTAAMRIKDSLLRADTVAFIGPTSIDNTRLFAQSVDFAQTAEVVKSTLLLKSDLRVRKTSATHFNGCEVETPSYYGNGTCNFTKTRLRSGFFQQNAAAEYTDSVIAAVDMVDVNDKQKAVRTTFVTQGEFCASSDVTLEEASKIVANTYLQTAGKLQSTGSALHSAENLILEQDVTAILDASTLSAELLSISGTAEVSKSELHAAVIQVFAELDMDKTTVTASREFFVSALAKAYLRDSSSLKATKVAVLGTMQVAEESEVQTQELDVAMRAVLSIETAAAVSTVTAAVAGLLDVTDASFVATEATKVTGEVSLQQCASAFVGKLEVAQGAQVVVCADSKIAATSVAVAGSLILDQAPLTAQGEVLLTTTSNVAMANAVLQARQEIEQRGAMHVDNALVKTADAYKTTIDAEISGASLQVVADKISLAAQTALTGSLQVSGNTAEVLSPLQAQQVAFNVNKEVVIKAPVRAAQTAFDTDFLTFETGGSVTGDTMSATTYATTLQPGSRLNVTTPKIQTVRYVNVGGLVARCDSHISAVIDLDIGLNVPTLPSIPTLPKNRAEAWGMVYNSTKLLSVGTTLLSNISRPAATLVGMGLKGKSLIDSRGKVYGAWANRHQIVSGDQPLRHYLAPLLQAKGLFVSSVAFMNEGYGLYQTSSDPLYQTPTWSTAENFGKDAFSILAPSETRESVFGLHGGLNASYTYNEQNAFGVNAGFTMAHNVRVQSAFNQYNFGSYDADTLNLEARKHFNYGVEHAHEKLIFTAREAHVGSGAVLRSDQYTQGNVTGLFSNAGTVDLRGAGTFKAGVTENSNALHLSGVRYETAKMHNAASATNQVTDHACLKTDEFINEGKSLVDKGGLLDAKRTHAKSGKLEVAADAKHFTTDLEVSAEQAYISAGILAGGIILGVDDEPDQFVAVDQVHVAAGASLKSSGMIKANKFQNDGANELAGAKVAAQSYTNNGNLHCEKNSHIESTEFISTEQSQMYGADGSRLTIDSKKSTLDGTYDAASLAVHDASMDGTQAAHLVEGSGEYAQVAVREALIVKCAEAVTLGKVARAATVAVALEAQAITTTENIELQNVSLKATAGDVNLRANVEGTDGAYIEATGDINKQRVALTSEHGNVGAECDGVLRNQDGTIKAAEGTALAEASTVENNSTGVPGVHSTITGKVVHVTATAAHVDNTGGHIIGTEVVYVDAKTDVINAALQRSEQRRFASATTYDPGLILGGAGNIDSNGIGAFVHAGRELINAASSIGSGANTAVRGDQAFRSETWSNTYTSHFDNHDVYQATEVGMARIFGAQNYLESAGGTVRLHGTQTASIQGTDIFSKFDAFLDSHVYKETHTHTEKVLCGLLGKKSRDETHTYEHSNVIATNGGNINIHSSDGAVRGLGTNFIFHNGGNLSVKSPIAIDLGRRKLEHSIVDRSAGWGFSVAGQSLTDHTPRSLQERAIAADPMFGSLFKAGAIYNPLEVMNAKNAYDDVTGLANDFATKGVTGALMERASASLLFTKSKTTTTFETAGAGGIYGATNVAFNAPNVTLGIDVRDVDNMSVKAKIFTLQNQDLHSSYKSRQDTFTTSLTATGALSEGVQRSITTGSSTTHTQGYLGVGHLALDVDRLDNYGYMIDAQTASGRLGALFLHSSLDEQRSKTTSVSINTAGNVSFSHTKQSSATVGAVASMNIAQGFDPDALHVGDVESWGLGDFAGFAGATNHALHEHNSASGHSIGFRLQQLQEPHQDGMNLNVGVVDNSQQAYVDQTGRHVTENASLDVDLRLKIDKDVFIDPKSLDAVIKPEVKDAHILPVDSDPAAAATTAAPLAAHATRSDENHATTTINAATEPSVEPEARSEAGSSKAAKPIIGPKTHTVRNFKEANGTTHHGSVKDGKFSQSASKKAAESVRKGESDPKLRAELELARDERVLYQDELELIPGLPTKLTVQTTAYAQANANLDPNNPAKVKDAKVFDAKLAMNGSVVTPLYSGQRSGAAGDLKVNVDGPSAFSEAAVQASMNTKGQVEGYVGVKALVVTGIARANYTSPTVCVKAFCAQVEVTLEAGHGIGLEVAKGSVSHKTAHTTTSTSTTKIGVGVGPMVAARTRVITSAPTPRFESDAMLPAPYNNPMFSGAGLAPMEMTHAYHQQLRQNACADLPATEFKGAVMPARP